jgi:hypothetical protein
MSLPADSKLPLDWNTVQSPKTRGKTSATIYDAKLASLEESLSQQKDAFDTHLLRIETRFDSQDSKLDLTLDSKIQASDRILAAIWNTSVTSTLSDDIATLSIDVCKVTDKLEIETRARTHMRTSLTTHIEGIKFDLQKESKALQIIIDNVSRTQASTPPTRSSSAKAFLCFSTSYRGIRNPVPTDLIANI